MSEHPANVLHGVLTSMLWDSLCRFGLSVNCCINWPAEGSYHFGAALMVMHSAVLMLAKVTLSPAPGGTMGSHLATSGAPARRAARWALHV